MQDYFQLWEKQGSEWRAILDSLRPEIDYVVSKHGMRVSPVRWDEPSLTLTWLSKGYHRSLRVSIMGRQGSYELALSGSIWRDVMEGEERRRQYAEAAEVGTVSIGYDIDMGKALPEVRNHLERARQAVERIARHDAEVVLEKSGA